MRFGKDDLIGSIGMGACFLLALGEHVLTSFDRNLFNTDYNVRGSPGFRKKIHHELMRRASVVEERKTGTVFTMPKQKIAVSLGRSKKNDEDGWFSLGIHKAAHLWGYQNLDSYQSLLGKEVHDALMHKKYGFGLVEEYMRCKTSFESPRIILKDIGDPRKVYVETCTIAVSHKISLGGANNQVLENPRTLSDISFAYEEGWNTKSIATLIN